MELLDRRNIQNFLLNIETARMCIYERGKLVFFNFGLVAIRLKFNISASFRVKLFSRVWKQENIRFLDIGV
ncbi:hypothetical protein NTGZN8_360008 [Candidatus Nitrotoga fabula]|uniref:Uncharacterized protein n=1 Tax=Candidatus Nitrotoga fabula TaxID=2182327 RepID=A0A916BEJ1_9PROT|nr:hypothetical protein NTGZN8_360008 [Candidatus Nitrotoga fabula]